MKIKIEKDGVTFESGILPIGEQIDVAETAANSLIAEGYASPVAENALKSPVGENGNQDNKVPGTGENGQPGGQTEAGGGINDGSVTGEDEIAKAKKALDDHYKRDELYEAAKKAGVEIAFDAKKGEIVDAVVALGKAEALLK